MNEETLNAFKEYEELKVKEREVTARLEELKPLIMPHVPEDKELQCDKGYFYLQSRTAYKYSTLVVNMDKELKEMKKMEERTGAAEPVTTPVLYYRSGKPEEKE